MSTIRKCISLVIATLTLLVMLLLTHPALAKGSFSKIAISGGSLNTEIEVTDPDLLDFFSLSDFPNARVEEPQVDPRSCFLLTRYQREQSGEFTPWDRLRYCPASSGATGYVYYEGLINGRSEYKGYWYRASPSGEKALMQAIATSTPAIPTSWPYTALVFSLILLGCATILMMALIVRRRTLSGSLPSSR